MPLFRTISPKGNVYTRKSNGPSTDPCGAPQDRGICFDFSSLTLTICNAVESSFSSETSNKTTWLFCYSYTHQLNIS